ncbi:MAG: hypothetical protein HC899_38595, partial [Leptolyngbyaceae cyanobacterium SM1_4_3]|nr:hypothetical protein [Leptolyngbyaceae cyanobacterium SM1_4_3]
VEFIVESPFIVDFDALAVRKDGEVQYYILYLAGQSFSDQDVIQGLLTDNPKFQTAEKIGSSSTIREAEQVYGPVTLSYNTQNESREYARFANQPAGNISFATGSGNAESAGIYASPLGAYNETQQFKGCSNHPVCAGSLPDRRLCAADEPITLLRLDLR